MPQLTQGLIVAVLIGLLLAVIVGYYLRQGQVNELTEALRQSQKRQEDLEQEHERRLREATQQLQQDYEAQLAESIERHQAQLNEQLGQLEAEYQARQGLVGSAAVETDSSVDQRIRKQYETRLKEVAGKMQQAYEQHLQARLTEERAIAQQGYDQRLAEAIARYQDQASLAQSPTDIPLGNLVPEQPVAGDPAASGTAELEARLQAEYDQRLAERIAQYQDDMAERTAQLEQEYAARLSMALGSAPGPVSGAPEQPSTAELELNLRRELEESLRVEYEQKLAEKIEHYQDELNQRTQELEQSYEARLQLFQAGAPTKAAPSVTDEAELDLEGAIAAANAAALAASIEASLGMDDVSLDSSEVSLDLDAFSPEAESSLADSDDLGLDLLDSDIESDGGQSFGQDDGLGLDTDFDTEDLESLLSAPGPDYAADDLLDSLDDISDLS